MPGMKQRRELGLKRFWSTVRSSNSSSSSQCEQGLGDSPIEETKPPPNCSLPLLQVWPSSDSPRGEADGQSFVFPVCAEDAASQNSTCFDGNHHDSGIESTQVSPCPANAPSPLPSPTPSLRRPSSALLLHPDHARLLRLYPASSPEHSSMEDMSSDGGGGGGGLRNGSISNGGAGSTNGGSIIGGGLSTSSSTTSSLTSVAAAVSAVGSRASDPTDRRRSSTITARYSLFDALDLEYALLRAAARGSVGPYSLSESLHKLTFTQSLAFPALARGLAGKRHRSQTLASQQARRRPLDPTESGLNAFAKVVTALVLVLVSILVFAVVYKFVRT